MASRTHHGARDTGRERPSDWDEGYEAGSLHQGKNIMNAKRADLDRGGASNLVSPSGGEYLSGAPRDYPGEAYSDQGFGKRTRTRPNWRTEDKIFGPDSVVHEGTPSQEFRGVGPRGYRRSDERIREDACEVLSDDPYLDASSIEVGAQDGEITLTGTVPSRGDKRRAEDLVEGIRGARDVHNRIRVLSPT
jgi:osmotically-inducible protein OsmY